MVSHRRRRLCSPNCSRAWIRNTFRICIPPRSAHHSRRTIFRRPRYLTCWISRSNTWKPLSPGQTYRPLCKTPFSLMCFNLSSGRRHSYLFHCHVHVQAIYLTYRHQDASFTLLCIASFHLYHIIARVFHVVFARFLFSSSPFQVVRLVDFPSIAYVT